MINLNSFIQKHGLNAFKKLAYHHASKYDYSCILDSCELDTGVHQGRYEFLVAYGAERVFYNLEELEEDFFKAIEKLKQIPFIDSENFIFDQLDNNKNILAEGAQGSLLDIDFGTYPYVTSSNTTAAGACTGLGVAPNKIKDVFGIFKAYTTRVGSGPFPTELFDKNAETMSRVGNEFGATTGRPRRCGWLDLVALKYAVKINGVTKLMMMKGDVLSGFKKIKVCTGYEYNGEKIQHFPFSVDTDKLKPIYSEFDGWKEDISKIKTEKAFPKTFMNYVSYLEKELQVPIAIISVGPDRNQTIIR